MLGRWWPHRRQRVEPQTAVDTAAPARARAEATARDARHAAAPAAGAVGKRNAGAGIIEAGATEAGVAAVIPAAWLRWLLDLPPTPPRLAAPRQASPASAGPDAHALATLADTLDLARLPRLPALLPTLLAALRRDTVTAQALADCIARDPVVAGEVLRVAGSAYYARGLPVAGLVPAVQRLGHEGLRRVALAVLMRPIAQADGPACDTRRLDRLWNHTQRTMAACALLAPGRCDPAEAQLAAVIGTTGLTALLRHAPHAVERLAGDAAARDVFNAGARLTQRASAWWQLPEAVQHAWSRLADAQTVGDAPAAVQDAAMRLAMASTLIEAGLLERDALDALPLPIALDASDRQAALTRLEQEFGGAAS